MILQCVVSPTLTGTAKVAPVAGMFAAIDTVMVSVPPPGLTHGPPRATDTVAALFCKPKLPDAPSRKAKREFPDANAVTLINRAKAIAKKKYPFTLIKREDFRLLNMICVFSYT